MLDECEAGLSQAHTATGSDQQRRTGLGFEASHLLRDRWLTVTESPGSGRQRAVLRDHVQHQESAR